MTGTLPASDRLLAQRLDAALGGRYRLTGLLGRGGFGVVFDAEEPALGRAVAIKVLRPEIAAPIIRERFRREASSAASLRHPHIIPIYAVGEQDDLCWCVMPRISGESLREMLGRERRLPVAEARRILMETALALGAAHGAGIIHRDVKPDNILLDGPERRVVLTDFGIAKSLSGPPGEAGLTTAGLVVGTPDYMSPEQAGGEPIIGPQSDLYSLGVVAYQMLAGERPFTGSTPGAVLLQQFRGPPVPLQRARAECPEGLAQTIHRCLALEPGERWESAEALIGALGRKSVPLTVPAGRSAVEGVAVDPVQGFRRWTLAVLALCLAAGITDLLRHTVLLLPLTMLLGAGLLAARYGTLWTRGYGWRQLLGREPPTVPGTPLTVAPARQARADRAAILKVLAALPRTERARLGPLAEALDGAIAELERLGGDQDAGAQGAALVQRITRLRLALEQRGEEGGPTMGEEVESFLREGRDDSHGESISP